MKLIPESLYNKLVMQSHQIGPKMPQSVEQEKSDILGASLPDDAKILLFNEIVRDAVGKLNKEKNKPVLIKNIADVRKNSTSDKTFIPDAIHDLKSPQAVEIHNFLRKNNIGYNDNMEVQIRGKTVPGSNYGSVVSALSNHRKRVNPTATLVMSSIDHEKIPNKLLTDAVLKKYTRNSTAFNWTPF